MDKIELLAPAGNLQKLKTVLYFGADAAYLGGKDFSLRSYADNFSAEEMKEAVTYAHERGKKIYVTSNIFAKDGDFEKLQEYLAFLQEINVDAVLVTDPGVIALAKEVAPRLTLHLSTQANTLNSHAVKFWSGQGIKRVVLARELSLAEIEEIHRENPQTELEAFVHGAMCVSFSGRCLLSNYFTSRDANRGECVQACRWNYILREKTVEKRAPLEIAEDERGTYFMNSKDLNLMENIPELISAGICSLKIEGRMKSEYYIATVVNAYRRALDEYYANGKITNVDNYNTELKKIVHRDYTKAYFLGVNEETISYDEGQISGTAEFTAAVLGYADGVATVEMRNRIRKGDVLEILSPNSSFNKSFTVGDITDSNGEIIDDAKRVQETLSFAIPYPVSRGDILRKI